MGKNEYAMIKFVYCLEFILVFILSTLTENGHCTTCKGTLNGAYTSESCSVGGCCVPSDGSGDTLCCIPTLTIILVSVFIGGTIVAIIVVISCCLFCRYRKRRKQRQRLEERRRLQRERDEERQRRLMRDPFVNGDPFITERPPSVEVTSQPPHYHGHESGNTNQTTNSTIPQRRVPPPYPKSPPPAYFSRIAMNHDDRHSRVSSRPATRTATVTTPRGQAVSTSTPTDIDTEIPTEVVPFRSSSTRATSNARNAISRTTYSSQINRNTPSGVLVMNLQRNQRKEQSVLSVQNLDEETEYNSIEPTENMPESRISQKHIQVNGDNHFTPRPQNGRDSSTSRGTYILEHSTLERNDSRESKIENRQSRAKTNVSSRNSSLPDSRLSTRLESRLFYHIDSDSRTSTRIQSRASTNTGSQSRAHSIIHNPETVNDKENTATRGLFIKSRISDIVEEIQGDVSRSSSKGRNYVRLVERDEPVISNLDYV